MSSPDLETFATLHFDLNFDIKILPDSIEHGICRTCHQKISKRTSRYESRSHVTVAPALLCKPPNIVENLIILIVFLSFTFWLNFVVISSDNFRF